MEKALRLELNEISVLNNKIYPTNAPEGQKPPYLVYIPSYYDQIKTFEGYQNSLAESYLVNVFAKSYAELQVISEEVKGKILSLPGKSVKGIHFKDIEINNIAGTWENELKLYRSILDFKFYYREE